MVSDDLILLSMAMEQYGTESLPGIWAIEALACSKQPSTSVLMDLIRRTPDLTADIGKNARELVCFKLLETFSAEGNQSNNEDASALHQKIEFDPSDSCEDVLGHMLQEISASNFKLAASKMLKWDVKSFIAHKRHSLPIFTLQKLKDAILEGSHSVSVSLKERSGVEVRTKFNNIPALGVSPSALGQIPVLSNKYIQTNQNLNPTTTENGVEELQENLPDRNSLLSKRKKIDISSEYLDREDQIMQDNCSDPHAESTKKFKQDAHITQNTASQESIKSARDGLFANFSDRITKDIDKEGYSKKVTEIRVMERRHTGYPFDAGDQPAAKKLKHVLNVTEHSTGMKSITTAGDEPLHNSPVRTIEHMSREGCNLEKEAEVRGMNTSHSEGGNQSKVMMLARSSEISCGGDGSSQPQDPINDNIEVIMPREVQGRSNCADKVIDHIKVFDDKASNGSSLCANEDHDNTNEAIYSFHRNVQGNTSTGCEANDSIEHNQVLEVAVDHDNFHDERKDIAAKKKAFLTSQCTSSEDSLATQPIFCMKCDRGGQLLTCGSSTCPLVVHESCLGTAAKFDEGGIFYCPFCMYSRAISECLEAKKKVTLARKDLATFIDLKVGRQPLLTVRSRTSKQNKVRQVDELCENNEANADRNPLDEIIHTHMRPNVEDNLQGRPSTSVAISGLPSGQTVGHLTLGEPDSLENEDLHGEGTGKECQSIIQPGKGQKKVQATKKSDPDIPSHNQADVPKRNQRQAVRRVQKKVKESPETPTSSESFNQTTSESSEEDDKSSSLKYSVRPRRPKMQYTLPAFPMLRRKRCPWTKLEEEKLKEGVEKFSNHLDSNIPWKTILEFGTGVFEKGRTAVDLKDKWRNMSK